VRALEVVLRQKENLDRVEAAVRLRVAEGREIPLEGKRAALNSARARQRIAMLEDQRTLLGRALASVAGLGGDVLITPAGEERAAPVLPPSEDASAQAAVENSRAIQKLESDVMVKGFEARGFRAAHKPRVSLVAQYALFAKYNHYEDYFQRFTRHNGQLGVSIEVPVFVGTLHDARAAQADIDVRRLRAQLLQTRLQISADARGAWTKLREAETADEIARMDLDIAREAVSVRLAETEAGRAGLRQVEEARFLENEKWLAFYDAHYALERCRLELLKQAGTLSATLR
jgi:outer membrane protein TolC